jgi:hypothetical protein
MPADSPFTYQSPFPYEEQRIGAAALYCSDGRIGEHVDDFLHQGLALPRYDRLTVPGGPACLAGHFPAWREEEAVVQQLQFLIEAHDLRRLVLLAHQQCAFYGRRLGLAGPGLEARLVEDLAKAAQRVRRLGPAVEVEAYLAGPAGNRYLFKKVDIGRSWQGFAFTIPLNREPWTSANPARPSP